MGAAKNRCLTEAAKLSGGRKASKWPPGEYALHGDPQRRDAKAAPAAFNCGGGWAHPVTPPQPITGDGRHLFTSESREERKRRKTEGAVNSSEGS